MENHELKHYRRHMSEFVNMRCAPDLLARKIYPNSKEITESMGAFNAMQRFLPEYNVRDLNVLAVAVGDGATPRTAAMFAFRTKWQCISIDPNMRMDQSYDIDRLTILHSRIEESDLPWDKLSAQHSKILVLAVHSHVQLPIILDTIPGPARLDIISIPCCVVQTIRDLEPDYRYEDQGIWSAMNKVKIWKDVSR